MPTSFASPTGAWLRKHRTTRKDVWLVYYRESSGKPRISYNDAVDEALCFGWIDSTVRRIDDERFAQRFTPRRPGSPISEMNRARVGRLVREKRMTTPFQRFPGTYRRVRIAFVEGARKRPDEFKR